MNLVENIQEMIEDELQRQLDKQTGRLADINQTIARTATRLNDLEMRVPASAAVALSRRLVELESQFRTFEQRASGLKPEIDWRKHGIDWSAREVKPPAHPLAGPSVFSSPILVSRAEWEQLVDIRRAAKKLADYMDTHTPSNGGAWVGELQEVRNAVRGK